MKKKGFTLVELLAVIVILAVIALIATPTILSMIEDSRKGSAIQSVNGILDAADNYIMSKSLNQEQVKESIDLTNSSLKYKGTTPEEGTLLIDNNGNMSIIAKIGKYCIEKKFNEDEPHIIEGECTFKDSETIKYEGKIALNKSGNECVTDSTKVCTSAQIKTGLKVSVNVNDNETYTFYAISDNGNGTINLIMENNIGKTAWASNEDYLKITGNACSNENGCNDHGPITAMKLLKKKTDNWKNVDYRTEKYNYFSTTPAPETATIDMQAYRSRLMTYDEASNLGCKNYDGTTANNNTCPSWLGNDYWLMTKNYSVTSTAKTIVNSSINSHHVTRLYLTIKPVITISKSMIK